MFARSSFNGGLRRALRLFSRPARIDHGRGGLVIQAYRGYGYKSRAFLMGRVFRQPALLSSLLTGRLGFDLANLGRRLVRRGVGDINLTARTCGKEYTVKTDRDGYFQLEMRGFKDGDLAAPWHRIDLSVTDPDGEVTNVTGTVYVPPPRSRFVVISDIDDTVVYTGVANKAKMLWRLFLKSAESRVAFPGVAALYRALHAGASGDELNPMLYVSRGPWSIYEVLEEFFGLHDIPVGPILFLRDWGLTLQHPLPRKAKDHKLNLIRDMLALYCDLPFLLIGDSGQRDPEIYVRIVREHPGRVVAVLIRRIGADADRDEDIEVLAKTVSDAGSHLVLGADSLGMADFLAEHGLISPETVAEVKREQEQERDETDRPVEHRTRETEDVEEALELEDDEAPPSGIVVEPKGKAAADRPTTPAQPS